MTAYYRAPGCDSVTIADVLPILSKITHYADEYVIGEMLIWDSGSQSVEPNNCAMVRVIVYNDGWICAWFDETTQNQISLGGAQYVDAQTLSGWGSTLEYEDRYNGCILKITASTDPDCPVDTVFGIRDTDDVNGRIQVFNNTANSEHFNSGYSYSADIYMSNGNLVWWGRTSYGTSSPTNLSNRLYRAIYQIWVVTKDSSNSTNWTAGNASLVYMYDSQLDTYTNETTDFNDVGVGDCQVFPLSEVINDAFYIGSSSKFNGVTITMGTPGIGSGITWEYWDGSAWVTLTTVDGTSGFTSTGELTFNPPDDWDLTLVNSQSYYWIRARITTASYTTTPLLTQGQLYDQDSISYIDTDLGVYNYEFTGANYLLLCGATNNAGNGLTTTKYCYTTVLPGKTTYDAAITVTHYDKYTGYAQVYINGVYLFYDSTSTNNVPGFIPISTMDYIYTSGIQNVAYLRNYGSTHTTEYCHSSVGMITICS
jgi:hypothetical protein